jgi:hypothetical protein
MLLDQNRGASDQPAAEPTQSGSTRSGRDPRSGAVTVWALAGLVWAIVSVVAVGRWMGSDTEFVPAPILGPDTYPLWREVSLRVLEALSMGVLLGFVWFCIVRPWRRDGRLSLEGKFVIGGMFGAVADAFLNSSTYLFAWNAHSVNWGVWTSFLPFQQASSSSRYAEGVLWGVPMYIYFCTGAALIGCQIIRVLRRRFPNISNAGAFSMVWLSEFLGGLLLENTIIRITQAYGYAQTNEALTLFPGATYQYPVYESLFTASLGVAFSYVRLSAVESPDGVSCVERGFERWRPSLQTPVRLLAVIGFSAVALIMMYHLPFNWLGVNGHSMADLPSYMLPG